jgi:DNA-directed RNA polymerase specialized sigma24 family protein
LPLEQRETLVAHLWGGLTFEQIGELTGVSSSTAHRRYLAGLSALRERLRVTCPNDPKNEN